MDGAVPHDRLAGRELLDLEPGREALQLRLIEALEQLVTPEISRIRVHVRRECTGVLTGRPRRSPPSHQPGMVVPPAAAAPVWVSVHFTIDRGSAMIPVARHRRVHLNPCERWEEVMDPCHDN